ncbi:MAG: LysR family transcriptional regulator, partial [Massilia sp.]|nr:LysR family transcriptional regulator [Massilia sp.]
MELRQLRYFIAVAEELHFTRAAARLHIGQPPLSHAIQSLEGDLGVQLFERTKRWVRLTEAGKLLLVDARRILLQVEQAGDTARRAERGEAGELR